MQAEADLAYWMMHPQEFGAAPQKFELAGRVEREFAGELGPFFVFKYREPREGGKLRLGVSGPFRADENPYESRATSFSRGKDGETPEELVDWYIGVRKAKKLST